MFCKVLTTRSGSVTVKLLLLLAVPPPVVTAIRPVLAPLGTVAVILVAETTVKLAAAVPLKLTAVAPVKLVPVMVTTVPAGPEVGVNEAMVGAAGVTVKVPEEVAV